MLSEFGVFRKALSEGHEPTTSYSSSSSSNSTSKKVSLHRRARSLFSLHQIGSISSLSDLRKGHLRTSSTTSDAAVASSIKFPKSTENKVAASIRRSATPMHLRRAIDDDNSRPYDDETLKQHGLDSDAFLGIALTTPDLFVDDENSIPRNHSKRRLVQQSIRYYHRPTQINVDFWPTCFDETEIENDPAIHSEAAAAADTRKLEQKSHIQVTHADWSPALLPLGLVEGGSPLSMHSFTSSSTMTYDSLPSGKISFDNESQEIWTVSTSDDDPPFLLSKVGLMLYFTCLYLLV